MNIDTAMTSIMTMSNMICSATHRLDKELNNFQREFNLPPDRSQWAMIVAQRLFARNEAFQVRARHELAIQRDFLLQLYPVSGDDLLDDFSSAMREARQTFLTTRRFWHRFAFLFEGYFVHLEVRQREELDAARTQLEGEFLALFDELTTLENNAKQREDCFKTLLTERGFSACLQQLDELSTWTKDGFMEKLAPKFGSLGELCEIRSVIREQCGRLCDIQAALWRARGLDFVPASEFVEALGQYTEYSPAMNAQKEAQQVVIDRLKTFISSAAHRASVLTTISGEEKPLSYFVKGFQRYDEMRVRCKVLTARCSEAAQTMRTHLQRLDDAHGTIEV